MSVHAVRSMPAFLQGCAGNGWAIVGADAGPASTDVRDARTGGTPTVLVLGSEGFGLRTLVRRACTGFLRIGAAPPAPAPAPASEAGDVDDADAASAAAHFSVDSLNVSVAAGILLHSLVSTADVVADER